MALSGRSDGPTPDAVSFNFRKDASGKINSAVVKVTGQPDQQGVKTHTYHVEQVTTAANNISLSGTLILPGGTGKFPLVVYKFAVTNEWYACGGREFKMKALLVCLDIHQRPVIDPPLTDIGNTAIVWEAELDKDLVLEQVGTAYPVAFNLGLCCAGQQQ